MIEGLKKMLEKKGDSANDFNQFRQMFEKVKIMKQYQLDILLRKAVESKVPNFGLYHDFLITQGADVNFYDLREYKTNLMIACESGNKQIVQTLSSNSKINFQFQDKNMQNALFYALKNRSKQDAEQYIKIILNKQPKLVESQATMQKTLLFSAVQKQRYQIIKILLEKGADPDKPISDTQNTPLHEAVKKLKLKDTQNLRKIIRILVQNNANYTIKNKQGKDIFQLVQQSHQTVKRIVRQIIQAKQKTVKQKRQQELSNKIFTLQSLPTNQKEEQDDSLSEQSEGYQQSFCETSEIFTSDLQNQILKYSQACDKQYSIVFKEFQSFLIEINKMLGPIGLIAQIYGSFATGLWLKNCDIDLLLIPNSQSNSKSSQKLLEEAYNIFVKQNKFKSVIINTKIKFPIVHIQTYDLGGTSRKIDVTIIDKNHNDKKSVNYIEQSLTLYPHIKPIFFVLKSLTSCYKLNDPQSGGIRTYALLIMLLSYVQKYQEYKLAELLVGFLHFFGFTYDYQQNCMILNIADPLNINNNVGKDTNVFAIQNMFKVVYISLHSKIHKEKLQFIFETKKLFA